MKFTSTYIAICFLNEIRESLAGGSLTLGGTLASATRPDASFSAEALLHVSYFDLVSHTAHCKLISLWREQGWWEKNGELWLSGAKKTLLEVNRMLVMKQNNWLIWCEHSGFKHLMRHLLWDELPVFMGGIVRISYSNRLNSIEWNVNTRWEQKSRTWFKSPKDSTG